MSSFQLTHDHLKLLSRANVRWEEGEYGAPGVDPKRPYGNSDVELDVAKILGWVIHGELSEFQHQQAAALHKETETALQIVLLFACQGLTPLPGLYRRGAQYDFRTWQRAGE